MVKADFDTMSATQFSNYQTATPPYTLEASREEDQFKCSGCYHPGHDRTQVRPDQQRHNHPHIPHPQANVVPLPLLTRYSALAECPGCNNVAPTNVKYHAGKGTHWMATLFFFTTGVFAFLPYAMDHFKNAEHACMKCGRKLATQRFGGSTKAHLM